MTTNVPTMTPFQAGVAERFGVLPNFFCTAAAAPGLVDELWSFARSAYLDSALPSLFKERLFVQLSRFCEIRYCIVRHVGFLVGLGRPAGDPDAPPESVDDVIALLSRPMPEAAQLAAALDRLRTADPSSPLPEPATQAEGDLFDALTVIFVEPARSERAREAVKAAVGDRMFEMLAAYLAFVRTAHFWTETHPELAFEPDMLALMEERPDLQDMLLSPDDAERVRAGGDLRRVLAELHQTEAALRASEARYRAFVNASADVVYRMSPDWSEMRELDGRGFIADTTAPSGDWRDRYILPDDRATVQAAIDAAVAARSLFALEHRVIRPDGSIGWTSSRAIPILDGSGGIVEWIGTASDVTEQRAAARELRESETRNLLLVESFAQTVWETDPAGVVVTDSPSWRAYTGQTLEEWLGYGWLEAIHPDDRAYAERQWGEAMAACRLVNAEFRLRAPDGGWRWTNVRAAPVFDDAGGIEKWAGINIDIDERKRAEAALRESEMLRLVALAGGRMGTWNWDLDERTCGGDAQFMALWGFPPSDDPRPLSAYTDRMTAVGAAQMEEIVTSAIAADEEFDGPLKIVAGPRAGHWIRWRGRATAGSTRMLHGVTFDITEQKRAEEQLRDSEARLRLLVAELQHRVRNILTVVRLTFSRSAESDGTKEELANHFLGRLDAMARTQVALTRHADRTANLEDLIRDELLSVGVRADGGAVTLAGPEIELDHKTAEGLAMVLHELTTNALKYGALCAIGATLEVTWQVNLGEGGDWLLNIEWSERGVPAIDVRPARRGFGRELIEEALPYRLGAETRLKFRGGGVLCDISIPLGRGEQRGRGLEG